MLLLFVIYDKLNAVLTFMMLVLTWRKGERKEQTWENERHAPHSGYERLRGVCLVMSRAIGRLH